MKIKFADLLDTTKGVQPNPVLIKILNADYERGAIALSKLTYNLPKTIKSAEGHLKDLNDARLKIVDTFDEEDKAVNDALAEGEEKADWRKSPVKMEMFNEELSALLETEIELFHTPLPRTIIDQIANATFKPNELESIKWFFEPDAEDVQEVSNVENIDDHRKKEAA